MKHLIAKRIKNKTLKTKVQAKEDKKTVSQQKQNLKVKEPIVDKTYTL